MNIRKEVKNYRNTLSKISKIQNKIQWLKETHIPSHTKIIDDMPKASFKDESEVEETYEKIEKDIEIRELEYQLNKLKLLLNDCRNTMRH